MNHESVGLHGSVVLSGRQSLRCELKQTANRVRLSTDSYLTAGNLRFLLDNIVMNQEEKPD